MHFSRHGLYPRNLIGQECLQFELRLKADFSLFSMIGGVTLSAYSTNFYGLYQSQKRPNGAAFPMRLSVVTRNEMMENRFFCDTAHGGHESYIVLLDEHQEESI